LLPRALLPTFHTVLSLFCFVLFFFFACLFSFCMFLCLFVCCTPFQCKLFNLKNILSWSHRGYFWSLLTGIQKPWSNKEQYCGWEKVWNKSMHCISICHVDKKSLQSLNYNLSRFLDGYDMLLSKCFNSEHFFLLWQQSLLCRSWYLSTKRFHLLFSKTNKVKSQVKQVTLSPTVSSYHFMFPSFQ